MLTRSTTYNSIYAGQHSVEWRITINGTAVYGMSDIAGTIGGGNALPTIKRSVFAGSSPAVGCCVAATFECTIFEASENVPRMATVVPQYRVTNGTSTSEWITLGTFYIDTRSVNKSTGALSLCCYDRMLVADGLDGKAYIDLTSFTTWPQSMSAVVAEIASIMGVTVDSRTVINTGDNYKVLAPNMYTMREVLGYIAAAHCGNWIITPENKLRLLPLTGGTDTLAINSAVRGLNTALQFSAWSGVTVYYDDESVFEAGTDTGMRLTCECPWATQGMVNDMLTAISGSAYQPYSADCAFADLALELGDIVTVGLPGETVSGPCFDINITCDVVEAIDIYAQGEQEVDHEYPYQSRVERQMRRVVKLGQSYYGTEITRAHGLVITKTNGVTEEAKVTLNSDELVFEDGDGNPVLYFDADKGTFVFDGLLGASAIYTDSLYAEQGDVAALTVNRLDTGNYIARYLTRNISDLNHIQITTDIYGLPHIYLMTSKVQKAYAAADGYERLTNSSGDELYWTDELMTATTDEETEYPAYIAVTAMTNPYGEAVYWSQDISGATITDGYPYVDGVRVYTTTEDTGYPVMVWDYNSQAKIDLTFVMGISGFYEPRIILGSGDNYGTSKGYIYKGQSGLDIVYDRSDAAGELALRLNDSGGIQKSLTTNGQTVQGTVAGMLIFENLYVSTSDWTLESPATFATYPYAATLTCTGANASMGGEVIFDPDDISTGSLATAAQSGTNTVTIYASEPMAVTVMRVELRF